MTVAAWLAAYSERWDCKACIAGERRRSYICPNRDGSLSDAMQRLSKFAPDDFPNILLRFDKAGVCPYMLISPLVRQFTASRRWFDTGQVGFSFLEAPSWYIEALNLYDIEAGRAMRFKSKEERSNGPRKHRK